MIMKHELRFPSSFWRTSVAVHHSRMILATRIQLIDEDQQLALTQQSNPINPKWCLGKSIGALWRRPSSDQTKMSTMALIVQQVWNVFPVFIQHWYNLCYNNFHKNWKKTLLINKAVWAKKCKGQQTSVK